MSVGALAVVDGVLSSADRAHVPLLDRGFLFGDAALEVLRTNARGAPHLLDRHLERMRATAAFLAIPWPGDAAFRSDLVQIGEGAFRLRLMLSGGSASGLGAVPSMSCRVVLATPLKLPPDERYENGGSAEIMEGRVTVLPGYKVSSYAAGAHFARLARARGVDEILLSDGEAIHEGASSNVFVVRAGALLTPGGPILQGITRARVLELATELEIAATEGALLLDALDSANEVFVTSSVRGIFPLRRVGTRSYGPPGPVTSALMARYACDLA